MTDGLLYYLTTRRARPPPLLTPLAGHPGAPRAVPPSQDTAYIYYGTPPLSWCSITTPPGLPKSRIARKSPFFEGVFFFFYRVWVTFTAKSPSFVGLLAVKSGES